MKPDAPSLVLIAAAVALAPLIAGLAHRFLLPVVVVELVVDVALTADDDLYLPDHLLDGDLLFPAVLGMEAMAQLAMALTGHTSAPVLENVELLRPIVVPPGGANTIQAMTTLLIRQGRPRG